MDKSSMQFLLSFHGIAHGLFFNLVIIKNFIYSKIFANFSQIEKTQFTQKNPIFSFVEKK